MRLLNPHYPIKGGRGDYTPPQTHPAEHASRSGRHFFAFSRDKYEKLTGKKEKGRHPAAFFHL